MWAVLRSKSTSWNPVERLLFPAPEASYNISSFPNELIFIPRVDGEKVPCVFLPFKHARFLILYFHANAEDLGLCYHFLKIMRDQFQVHMLAVEYPGYGLCPGKTDEAGIMVNARAAMYFATETLGWPCDGIKLFGRSLGTGPTMALATLYDVAGVILVSPFTSIRSLFRTQIGSLADIVADRFRNYEVASRINSATLIIHGQQDTLIPLEHGKTIYDLLVARKMMVCPAAMGHNTSLLKSIGTFVLPMTQFFSLPDYTFEDIEVPDWVFPDRHARIGSMSADSPDSQEDPFTEPSSGIIFSPRGTQLCVPDGGSAQGSPRDEAGEGAAPEKGTALQAGQPSASSVQPVRLSPRTPRKVRDGSGSQEVNASRNYEFAPAVDIQMLDGSFVDGPGWRHSMSGL
mmetsp:Transcript_11674/g.33031  ORF Transcript_11674/g.33031 Transcript_11674/m.33031 type:complete len:402 (+) Transcript_11674:76-1281(+)